MGSIQRMRRRKVESPFYYSPGKKTFQLVAKLRDTPGALGGLLDALGTKVNLLWESCYTNGDGTAFFVAVAEPTKKSEPGASIRAIMARVPSVLDCAVWGSRDGLLVDWFHTGIESGMGEPYILMPTMALSRMFEEIAHTFGSGGEVILYLEGKKFAEARFKAYRDLFGQEMASRINELSHIFEALGYGESKIRLDETQGSVTIETHDCFECSAGTKSSRTCAFTKGIAVGIFEPLLRVPLEVEETRCRLQGNKYCEFELRRKQPSP